MNKPTFKYLQFIAYFTFSLIGVHDALNALETEFDATLATRHRITHLELIKPEDLERFDKFSVIADFQLAGDFTLRNQDNREHLETIIGPDRANKTIPLKKVFKTGAKVNVITSFSLPKGYE